MRRVPAALLLVAGMCWPQVCPADVLEERVRAAESFQTAMATIDSLLQAGEPASAAAAARTQLARFREDPLWGSQIRARLGLALLRVGQAEQALPLLEDGVRAMPTDATLHRNLAAALMSLGRRGRALTEFQQAVGLDPGDPQLRLEFGQALVEMRAFADAQRELVLAKRLCEDCLAAERALARLFLTQGDDGAAVPYLQRLYAAEGDSASRRELLGALQRSGAWAEVVAVLETLPVDQLEKPEALLLAEGDAQLGHRERALAWVRAQADPGSAGARPAPAAGRDSALFWGTLALNLLEGGYLQESLAASDLALELDPANAVYRHNRVAVLQRLGRTEEADREWRRLQELTGQTDHQDGEH